MGQTQVKQFSGFGIVYPDGVSGIKVIRTFTQGPSKVVNPDGSVAYTTPPPTIHELFGGGFAYADGSPVNNREHLELLPAKMREKALKWFDGNRELPVVAKEDIPPLDLEKKIRPEPVYILSSDLPTEKDEVTKDLNEQVIKSSEKHEPEIDSFTKLLTAINDLASVVKDQGKQIEKLKASQPQKIDKRRRGELSQEEIIRRSERMKKRREEKKRMENGKNITEAS